MKIYAGKSTYDSEINKLDRQIIDFLKDNLINRDFGEAFGRGGYVYIFKINNNAYRVFCDDVNAELIFQLLGYGYDLNGNLVFDDPNDYKSSDTDISNWFNLIRQWISECETEDPHFTEYEQGV